MMTKVEQIILECRKRIVGRTIAGGVEFDDVNIRTEDINFRRSHGIGLCNMSYYIHEDKQYPIYWADIEIPDIATPSMPAMVASKVAKIDNTYFFYGIHGGRGVMHQAGNTHAQYKSFSIDGNAMEVIHESVSLIRSDNGFGTYDLCLNPTDYIPLLQASANRMTARDAIQSFTGGLVYPVSIIPEGSGILMLRSSPTKKYINYILHSDWQFNQLDAHTWRVWFSASPICVTNPNFMCLLRNI